MLRGGAAEGGGAHSRGIGTRIGNQFGHVFGRHRGMHYQHIGGGTDHGDGHQILGGVIGQIGKQRRRHHEGRRHQHDGVTVGGRLRRDRGANSAARAGAIIDQHRLAHRFGHLLRQQARNDVVAAAGRIGDDELDRAIGVGILVRLGLDSGSTYENGERGNKREQKFTHERNEGIRGWGTRR